MTNDDLRRAQILTHNLLTVLFHLDTPLRDELVGKIIRGSCMISAIQRLQAKEKTAKDDLHYALGAFYNFVHLNATTLANPEE